jgi:hypothetical protein
MNTATDFPTAYMRLRTLLDALAVNTLRYCMDGVDPDAKISRMKGVEADLMNMIEHVGGEAPCDAGYYNCGGVCVPYSCLEDATAQAAE